MHCTANAKLQYPFSAQSSQNKYMKVLHLKKDTVKVLPRKTLMAHKINGYDCQETI